MKKKKDLCARPGRPCSTREMEIVFVNNLQKTMAEIVCGRLHRSVAKTW